MDINRKRPPKDCEDLGLWLSGTINDALRDAKEAGCDSWEAAYIALSLAATHARVADVTDEQIRRAVGLAPSNRTRPDNT